MHVKTEGRGAVRLLEEEKRLYDCPVHKTIIARSLQLRLINYRERKICLVVQLTNVFNFILSD